MSVIPHDYIERCYAGWLGKLIGIRYGAPIENWSYEKIQSVYGELDGYPVDYDMFAADDDSNGPMIFIRALNDATCTRDITPHDIAQTWLNYVPYEHGFYWWGGYGISTEHTAYLNLTRGIPAPRSGSIEQNGATSAEQIGGQIFIDTWGLVFPNQPELAAEYAAKAASVSHDGNGIYGGQYVAAAIALAFTAKNIREVLDRALDYIPADCEYARAVRDIMRFYDANSDKSWREGFRYLKENWGYSWYSGGCHIIPNAAVMVLSMLYGKGDFGRTLSICNMCGWDTDCNVGNVGTIMGVLCGLNGIDQRKWRDPINDVFAVSSVLGCLNLMDAPWCTAYLSELAYRMAGEEIPLKWKRYITPDEQYYHFRLPGSTHGFKVIPGSGVVKEGICQNTGLGSLKAGMKHLNPGCSFRIAKRTHLYPSDFHDNRYEPVCAPILFPGQRIVTYVKPAEYTVPDLWCCMYVRIRGGEYLYGEKVKLPERGASLSLNIPTLPHMLIEEMGIYSEADVQSRGGTALLEVTGVRIKGKPHYDIDFSFEEEYPTKNISQFTRFKGDWHIENGQLKGHADESDRAECYTGDIRWTDYTLTGEITPILGCNAALNVRVQGAARSYAVALNDGKLMIRKNENGYRTLAECDHPTEIGTTYRLKIVLVGSEISVYENDVPLLCVRDEDKPYLNGCIGCSVRNGTWAYFNHLEID